MLACQYAISLQLIYYIVAGRRWAKLPTPTMTLQSWHLILFNYHITIISTQGKSYQLFFNSLINLYLDSSVTFISYRFYKMAPRRLFWKTSSSCVQTTKSSVWMEIDATVASFKVFHLSVRFISLVVLLYSSMVWVLVIDGVVCWRLDWIWIFWKLVSRNHEINQNITFVILVK